MKKYHCNWLRNDRALGNRKSDNNKNQVAIGDLFLVVPGPKINLIARFMAHGICLSVSRRGLRYFCTEPVDLLTVVSRGRLALQQVLRL